jgi:hypothetical protein
VSSSFVVLRSLPHLLNKTRECTNSVIKCNNQSVISERVGYEGLPKPPLDDEKSCIKLHSPYISLSSEEVRKETNLQMEWQEKKEVAHPPL